MEKIVTTIKQAVPMIDWFMANNMPPMIEGAPGIGKSDLVRELARRDNAIIVDFRASLREPVDLRGFGHVDLNANVTRFLMPAELPFVGNSAFPTDRPIYLFMDELTNAGPAMQAACFQLVLDRAVGEHRLMDNVKMVAACNSQAHKASANRISSALANRFTWLHVIPDPDSWLDWAGINGIEPALMAFIKYRSELLHKMDGDLQGAWPSPRGYERVNKAIADATLPAELKFPIYAAIIGAPAAIELKGFLDTIANLPKFADIVSDPDNAMVPSETEPSAQYAVARLITSKADANNFNAVMAYAQRLPKEFEIMVATDAIRREPTLKTTSAFVQWAVRNQDVTKR